MSSSKYTIGTKLIFCDPQSGESFSGHVVENVKFTGDICVNWDIGLFSSYDESWLNQFTVITSSVSES
jgi:hypothetical protein